MRKKNIWLMRSVLGAALVLGACGAREKQATEAAVNAAESALAAAQGEAAKYAPEELKAAQDALQSAKNAVAKGDYHAALAAAADATNKTKSLAATAAARKDELVKGWNGLSASVPRYLNAIKGRLDVFEKGARMPAGLDQEKLQSAKQQYERAKQVWSDAAGSAQQGNLGEAMKKASGLKEVLVNLMVLLGIKT